MTASTCEMLTLHQSSHSEVQFCRECRLLHVSVGPITLRFTPEQYQSLARGLGQALTQLQTLEAMDRVPVYTLHS
jgi:hypothetical protein